MKKHKSIIMIGALILMCTGAFLLGTVYMQHREEQKVQAASSNFVKCDDTSDVIQPGEKEEVQKNLEEQLMRAEEAAGWEVSLQFAKDILERIPDVPLLQEDAEENYGDSSLENFINDVNAIRDVENRGAKNVIRKVCEDAGIDANKAKVRDLTKEQIAQIDQVVFQNSDHIED